MNEETQDENLIEAHIDGVLNWSVDEGKKWTPYTPQELTALIVELGNLCELMRQSHDARCAVLNASMPKEDVSQIILV